MSENLVRADRTPLGAQALYDALRTRWRALGIDTPPSLQRVLVLVAHVWHETGAGIACHCWNLAGIKWTKGCGHDLYQVRTTEDDKAGKPTVITAPFRAYATLEESVADYLGLIRGQFGFAWPAVEAADPRDFAHRLRARGYYTAPEQTYADALVARYRQVTALISEDTQPDTPSALAIGRPAYVLPDDEPDDPPPATD